MQIATRSMGSNKNNSIKYVTQSNWWYIYNMICHSRSPTDEIAKKNFGAVTTVGAQIYMRECAPNGRILHVHCTHCILECTLYTYYVCCEPKKNQMK